MSAPGKSGEKTPLAETAIGRQGERLSAAGTGIGKADARASLAEQGDKKLDARPPFAGLGGRSPEELFGALPTPCYILDEAALRRNGEILAGVSARTGCRILLAQKAFSNYDLYPVLAPYLAGTEASGLYEARLGAEEMPEGEVHVFCGAYRESEFGELLRYADHIVFNSPNQLARFGERAKAAGKSVGLRINPECSTQEGHVIYERC
jgi:carboxynorspermidine decarboxylase